MIAKLCANFYSNICMYLHNDIAIVRNSIHIYLALNSAVYIYRLLEEPTYKSLTNF